MESLAWGARMKLDVVFAGTVALTVRKQKRLKIRGVTHTCEWWLTGTVYLRSSWAGQLVRRIYMCTFWGEMKNNLSSNFSKHRLGGIFRSYYSLSEFTRLPHPISLPSPFSPHFWDILKFFINIFRSTTAWGKLAGLYNSLNSKCMQIFSTRVVSKPSLH